MDFQANELGVGLVPTPRERLPILPRPSQLHPLPPTLPCCAIISAQKDPEKQVSPEEGEVGLGHPAWDQLSQGSNPQGLGAQNSECGQTSQVGLYPWAPTRRSHWKRTWREGG